MHDYLDVWSSFRKGEKKNFCWRKKDMKIYSLLPAKTSMCPQVWSTKPYFSIVDDPKISIWAPKEKEEADVSGVVRFLLWCAPWAFLMYFSATRTADSYTRFRERKFLFCSFITHGRLNWITSNASFWNNFFFFSFLFPEPTNNEKYL